MKKFVYLLVLVSLHVNLNAQNFSYGWHQTLVVDKYQQVYCNKIHNDTLYSFVNFQGDSIDADPSNQEDWITSNNDVNAVNIMYVTKHLLDGTYIESFKLLENDQSSIYINDVEFDNNGNILILGYTYVGLNPTELDFDPSPASVGSYSLSSNGNITFLAFYTANGQFNARIEYPSSIYFSDMTVNDQNELYLAGEFNGVIDMDFTAGIDSVYNSNLNYGSDAIISKINLNNQTYIWSKTFGSSDSDNGIAFIESKNNKLFLMGYYEDPILDLDLSSNGTWNIYSSDFSYNTFLSVWSSNGDFLSGMGLYGQEDNSSVYPLGIAVDDQNNLYVNAYTYQNYTVDLDPTLNTRFVNSSKNNNHFIAKYSENMVLLWNSDIQNDNDLYVNNEYDESSLIMSETYLGYMVASSEGLLTYTSDAVVDTISNMNNYGVNFTAINTEHGYIFHSTNIEGNNVDESYISAYDFDIDQNENIHLIGNFENTIDFNQFDSNTNYDTSYFNTFNNNYNSSIFNLMLSPANFLGIEESPNAIEAQLYPNPTKDRITITTEAEMKNISIFDLQGNNVLSTNVKGNMKEINVEHLQTGMYVVIIATDKGIINQRFSHL